MLKRIKGLLIFGAVLLIIGSAIAFAADQVPLRTMPRRAQMLEILEKYPEALEELRALDAEQPGWDKSDFGSFQPRGWHMGRARGYGSRMGYCHSQGSPWFR